MAKLKKDFYLRPDVTAVAREMLGKRLVTRMDGVVTAGIIVETEAYSWQERGCHAYNNRKTRRNAMMFGPGGYAYVYLCYGIHALFNVVTNHAEVAEAVLVRAVQPERGQLAMQQRCSRQDDRRITSGPGKLTRALGITTANNGVSLLGNTVWLEDGLPGYTAPCIASERIGIDYAGSDAHLPWRFSVAGNPWVSR